MLVVPSTDATYNCSRSVLGAARVKFNAPPRSENIQKTVRAGALSWQQHHDD